MLSNKFICSLFNFILPSSCLLCSSAASSHEIICSPCRDLLPILPQSCPQCAQSLSGTFYAQTPCGACLAQPPAFERAFPLFPYETPIISLIVRLKFKHDLSHAKAFAHLLLDRIQNNWYLHEELPDLILPVPLHPTRLRERGFNQALEIAKPLARALDIPIDAHGISRIKNTAPQSSLPAAKRSNNVAGAFFAHHRYQDKHIAIIDDVMTTGQTCRALAATLQKAGARKIHLWCVARRS